MAMLEITICMYTICMYMPSLGTVNPGLRQYDMVQWNTCVCKLCAYPILCYIGLHACSGKGVQELKNGYACMQVVHQLACVVQCKLEQQPLARLRGNALSTATAVAGSA